MCYCYRILWCAREKADLRDYHAARRDDWKAYAGGPLHLSTQSRFPRDGSGKKGLQKIEKKRQNSPYKRQIPDFDIICNPGQGCRRGRSGTIESNLKGLLAAEIARAKRERKKHGVTLEDMCRARPYFRLPRYFRCGQGLSEIKKKKKKRMKKKKKKKRQGHRH